VEFAIFPRPIRPGPLPIEIVRGHVAALAGLDDACRLFAAGPLADGSGGRVLASFESLAEADRFASSDPLVTGGWETAKVRPWQWANRSNGHLGGLPLEGADEGGPSADHPVSADHS
jgi:uncharacterized protein YciI